MEEKLYFKPEASKRKPKNKKEEKGHKFLKLFFFLLFLLVIVLIIIWLLRGSKTISGQYPENVKNEALECKSENKVYSKVDKLTPVQSEIKISAIFRKNNELNTINLKYTAIFNNDTEAYSADAILNAQFNNGLSVRGFPAGKFNNKFTLMDNSLTITLYGTSKEINEYTGDYFLIEELQSLRTVEDYENNYKKQGFSCNRL